MEEKNLNKTTKIILLGVALIIIIAVSVSLFYFNEDNTANTTLPQGSPPAVQLRIIGGTPSEAILTVSDLAKMPLTRVTYTIKGETATYTGVTITQLINETNASWDTGFIDFIAADGFKRTINTYQAFNSTQYPGNEFILAFVKDNSWIIDTSEGPLKLIAPGLASNFNVRSVEEISLKPWTIVVNGTVQKPLIITGSNITSFEVKTVTAAFSPGGEAQRTSDWTGATIQSILTASGSSLTAEKITVKAIDGYSREFTMAQMQRTGMLLGYEENGAYLSPIDGAPFRLFVPTEEFKWGQNWVRWVSEIIVS